jgi:Big-like domain-containing protein
MRNRKYIFIVFVVLVWQYFGLVPAGIEAAGGSDPVKHTSLTGQIVVDPENPGRMVYHETYTEEGRLQPVFFAGPGDPEDFFYCGKQGEIIKRFRKLNARCTYITAVLKDFGGGDPGTGAELERNLARWDRWITKMEQAEVITVFFFFDDDGAWRKDWKTFIEKIVGKLKRHRLLIWCIAEEYAEGRSKKQISEFAAYLKQVDNHNHVVAVHQNSSSKFDFNHDENIDMFAIQYNTSSPENLYAGVLDAWNNVGGQKILNMSEMSDHGVRDDRTIRRCNWAAAMAGASAVQILRMGMFFGDKAGRNTPQSYRDCAILTDFMEATDFHCMHPANSLAAAGTKYLLAQPGLSYLAYADELKGDLGIKNLSAGEYQLMWIDIAAGKIVKSKTTVRKGSNEFQPPAGFGKEVAVWIRGVGRQFDPVLNSVIIIPSQATILLNQRQFFQAIVRDQFGRNRKDNFSWSVDSGGTIKEGIFQSNNQLGRFTITASSQTNPDLKATAVIHVVKEYPAPKSINQAVKTKVNRSVSISLRVEMHSPGSFEYVIMVKPKHGKLSQAGNDIEYKPDRNYQGTDRFSWQIKDTKTGKTSSPATVTITVNK